MLGSSVNTHPPCSSGRQTLKVHNSSVWGLLGIPPPPPKAGIGRAATPTQDFGASRALRPFLTPAQQASNPNSARPSHIAQAGLQL